MISETCAIIGGCSLAIGIILTTCILKCCC